MIPTLMIGRKVTEIDGTTTQVIQGYDATTLNTDPNMEVIFGELKPLSALFTSAIRRMKAKSEAQTLDEVREEKMDGWYYLLLSFSHHPDAQIRNAALALLTIFNNYGMEIKKESFTVESSLLNSMLADYSTPEAMANVRFIPQGDIYLAALQEAQDNFESNRLGFEEAQAEEGTLENASALKRQVVDLINNKLVNYLNAMAQINEATYGPYARIVAEIISTNNEVVRKRRNSEDETEEE
ncbi:DUF6261 family protein [Draconibacterium sp.]|uniref:DUF6261 family protein n=1 Tax=Draconibacterium sp. TaxID=1965318 RepID=UPI003561297D